MFGRCWIWRRLEHASSCLHRPLMPATRNQDRVSRPDRLQCTICSGGCPLRTPPAEFGCWFLCRWTFTKKVVMLTEIQVKRLHRSLFGNSVCQKRGGLCLRLKFASARPPMFATLTSVTPPSVTQCKKSLARLSRARQDLKSGGREVGAAPGAPFGNPVRPQMGTSGPSTRRIYCPGCCSESRVRRSRILPAATMPPADSGSGWSRSGRLGLGHMGRDRIHQRRRQAVIGLEPEFLQTGADAVHLLGLDARFDDGGHEGGKSGRCRAALLEQFGVNEVEPVERMAGVLDATVHVGPAGLAGMALDDRGGIDDLQLVAILQHGHVLPRHDGDDGEGRALRLPALGAAAGMVMGDVALDADLDRMVGAFADQGPSREGAGAFFHAVINRWVDVDGHSQSSLCATFLL